MADNDRQLRTNISVTEETLRESLRMQRIAAAAVQKAQAENRRLDIPNWYCINGHIVSDIEIEQLAVQKAERRARAT